MSKPKGGRTPDEFAPAVAAYSVRRALISNESRVLVGLSGGPDSCALLLALHEASEKGLIPRLVGAAHFHHGLRGTDADGDAAFSAALAARLGVPCIIGLGAVKDPDRSPNDAARRARYDFLTEAMGDLGADTLATAHTADDQAETVLGRVLRGAGVDGLSGIPTRRALAPGLVVVRPLLGMRRSEIEAFCAARGVVPRQDPSNEKDRYARARLRKQLPELAASFNPRLVEALARLAESAATDADLLNYLADDLMQRILRESGATRIRLDRHLLRNAHPALRRRVLRNALWKLAGGSAAIAEVATGEWIMYLEDWVLGPTSGVPNDLPGGIRARLLPGELLLEQTGE